MIQADRKVYFERIKRVVVKVGTRLVTGGKAGFEQKTMRSLVAGIAELRARGLEVILVSSGAVGLGMKFLGVAARPTDTAGIQAMAAVGQGELIHLYTEAFREHGLNCAQILLTQTDLSHRRQHLNARATMNSLLAMGVIPIVNENDTVSVDELRFGDNDILAGLTANLVSADLLILLSDVEALLRTDGTPVRFVPNVDDEVRALDRGTGGTESLGGMSSKLRAAQVVTEAGACAVIADGRVEGILSKIMAGENTVGTFFAACGERMSSRKRWIAYHLRRAGRLVIDAGAARALIEKGRSLLPVGITAVEGTFEMGSLVDVAAPDGQVIARGISNFSSAEIERIKGKKTEEIEASFGPEFALSPAVIHRDDMVIERSARG